MDHKMKLTRRRFFRTAATIAGAAAAASVIPIRVANAKVDKASMKYQDKPKDGQQCDQCMYFQPPDACVLVEGKISPHGWCAAYSKKK